MPKKWTGDLVGLMHTHGITFTDLADEMGVTNRYISAILNSHKEPAGIEERVRAAVNKLIEAKDTAVQ